MCVTGCFSCDGATTLIPHTFQDDAEIVEDTTEDTPDTVALAAATGVFGSGARAASALSARRRCCCNCMMVLVVDLSCAGFRF